MTAIPFQPDDGGRAAAGYIGTTGDCVTRAIAIATDKPYSEVYDALYAAVRANRAVMAKLQARYGAHVSRHLSPRTGVPRQVYQPYLEWLGWKWTPTMEIGSGCRVHLRADELPGGNLVVRLSRHLTAVVDGVLHDNHDCSRWGTRCVYGYFQR